MDQIMTPNTQATILVSQLHPLTTNSNQVSRIVFRVQVDERSFDLYIESSSLIEQPGLEAAVPLALLPAMKLGQPIHVKGAVSKTFLDGVRRVMDYYAASFEGFSIVPITADSYYQAKPNQAKPSQTKPETSQRKASFFSGGVDSFFTLLKARDELTDIITIRGFDMSLSDDDRWQKTSASAQIVANQLNIQRHEVESNFGSIIKEFGLWIEHGHGMALACVARSLAGLFGEIRVPGSDTIEDQIPWGSSIFTDPLYSDERLSIVHDACTANRADKIIFLSKEPLALKHLRVCPGVKNDGNYNCCRCEKCLRTMLTFYTIGALDTVPAFPLPLTPAIIAGVLVTTEGQLFFTDENIQLMQRYRPDDKAMLRALRIQRNRPFWVSNILILVHRKCRHLVRNIKKIMHRIQLRAH
jgi:hypothetical protein